MAPNIKSLDELCRSVISDLDDGLAGYRSLKTTDMPRNEPATTRHYAPSVDDVSITRDGFIDIVVLAGEHDMSNVDALNDALQTVLSDETTSGLLDLSAVTLMDSTVIDALVRWSKEAQVSECEALAIVVGGTDTPAARALGLVGLLKRLPTFATRDAAKAVLDQGRRPRLVRP